MTVLEVVRERRSCREFADSPISEESLRLLVEAANWAPSASNAYPWKVAIVRQPSLVERLVAFSPGILGDPAAMILFCTAHAGIPSGEPSPARLRSTMDIAHAAQNVCLVATELGIGSCCVLSFNSRAVGSLLKLPAPFMADYIVALGYPRSAPGLRTKRPVEDAVLLWS